MLIDPKDAPDPLDSLDSLGSLDSLCVVLDPPFVEPYTLVEHAYWKEEIIES